MHPGQHAQCAIPHRRANQPSGHILLQHINLSQPRDQRLNRNPPHSSLVRHCLHHLLVLLRLQRAGGVHQPPARLPAAPALPLRIARCRADCRAKSSTRSRCRISGLRASVPVPLHGTSHRIRSNFASRSSSGGAAAASITAQRTRSAYAYRRSRAAICANRFALTSVARISASGPNLVLRCGFSRRASTSVFPPGAAQQSHTRAARPVASGIAAAASSATSRDPSSICGAASAEAALSSTKSAPASRLALVRTRRSPARPRVHTPPPSAPPATADVPAAPQTPPSFQTKELHELGAPHLDFEMWVDSHRDSMWVLRRQLAQHRVHHPRRMGLPRRAAQSPRSRSAPRGPGSGPDAAVETHPCAAPAPPAPPASDRAAPAVLPGARPARSASAERPSPAPSPGCGPPASSVHPSRLTECSSSSLCPLPSPTSVRISNAAARAGLIFAIASAAEAVGPADRGRARAPRFTAPSRPHIAQSPSLSPLLT